MKIVGTRRNSRELRQVVPMSSNEFPQFLIFEENLSDEKNNFIYFIGNPDSDCYCFADFGADAEGAGIDPRHR
ncbi:MAG: hypothetical protein Fur0044_04810 [Anaerolineae bacterium]